VLIFNFISHLDGLVFMQRIDPLQYACKVVGAA